ncbi:hypothetical protein C8Q75DRAFT_803670 [Abortiporus biennis]|nr:hypothetical protein C8Q75DRAFT_803670 [Abortiporus biennis]
MFRLMGSVRKSPVICGTARIVWSGGQAPYSLTIFIQVFNVLGQVLETTVIASQSNVFVWDVDIAPGITDGSNPQQSTQTTVFQTVTGTTTCNRNKLITPGTTLTSINIAPGSVIPAASKTTTKQGSSTSSQASPHRTTQPKTGSGSKSSAKSPAVYIGIIIGLLVLIVLGILAFFFYRRRQRRRRAGISIGKSLRNSWILCVFLTFWILDLLSVGRSSPQSVMIQDVYADSPSKPIQPQSLSQYEQPSDATLLTQYEVSHGNPVLVATYNDPSHPQTSLTYSQHHVSDSASIYRSSSQDRRVDELRHMSIRKNRLHIPPSAATGPSPSSLDTATTSPSLGVHRISPIVSQQPGNQPIFSADSKTKFDVNGRNTLHLVNHDDTASLEAYETMGS